MKYKECLKCGKAVSKKCLLGYCNKCRDRNGVNNPFYGKKHKDSTIKIIKEKTSINSIELWKDEVYRNKVINAVSKPRAKYFKDQQSNRIKQWYIDNPNQRILRSVSMKKSWKNGKIIPTINSINESNYERELRSTLKIMLPLRNIRKTTIKIGKKWFYPDIRIDKNIIVEFYGDYWHANPEIYKSNDIVSRNTQACEIWKRDRKRVKILEENGFMVFIIWQKDYEKDKNICINNLLLQL